MRAQHPLERGARGELRAAVCEGLAAGAGAGADPRQEPREVRPAERALRRPRWRRLVKRPADAAAAERVAAGQRHRLVQQRAAQAGGGVESNITDAAAGPIASVDTSLPISLGNSSETVLSKKVKKPARAGSAPKTAKARTLGLRKFFAPVATSKPSPPPLPTGPRPPQPSPALGTEGGAGHA